MHIKEPRTLARKGIRTGVEVYPFNLATYVTTIFNYYPKLTCQDSKDRTRRTGEVSAEWRIEPQVGSLTSDHVLRGLKLTES